LEPYRFDELEGWRQWLRRLQAIPDGRQDPDRRRQPSPPLMDLSCRSEPVMERSSPEQTFDALTRRAAQAVSRRDSLRPLSGAALALGSTEPRSTAAKKGGKHGNRGTA